MRTSRIVVGTDILEEHVRGTQSPSVLRIAMGRFLCYTTVFNAIELLANAVSESERRVLIDAMGALKILGLNAKHAVRYAGLFRRHPLRGKLNLLVAGQCCESKLPLLTRRKDVFRRISGLTLLAPEDIMQGTVAATLSRRPRSTR